MASNGCGLFGGLSFAHRKVYGAAPAYEVCCDEHDLAYEQADTPAERKWADDHFLRCMRARGYPKWGAVFYGVVRYGGWLTWPKRWVCSLF